MLLVPTQPPSFAPASTSVVEEIIYSSYLLNHCLEVVAPRISSFHETEAEEEGILHPCWSAEERNEWGATICRFSQMVCPTFKYANLAAALGCEIGTMARLARLATPKDLNFFGTILTVDSCGILFPTPNDLEGRARRAVLSGLDLKDWNIWHEKSESEQILRVNALWEKHEQYLAETSWNYVKSNVVPNIVLTPKQLELLGVLKNSRKPITVETIASRLGGISHSSLYYSPYSLKYLRHVLKLIEHKKGKCGGYQITELGLKLLEKYRQK
jgi:hypothetical protein